MLLRLALFYLIAIIDLSRSDLTSREIASWDRPRAALIRNNIYLHGGIIQNGSFIDGDWAESSSYLDTALFKLSLNDSFDISGDTPARFESIWKNNGGTLWLDGFMVADDDEFYTYGGRAMDRNTQQTILSYPLYDTGAISQDRLNEPDFGYVPRPASFQYKISNGAGANAPSENRGFYFGGLRKEDNGVISYQDLDTELSNTLLIVDTSVQNSAEWTIPALPGNIRTRAEAGLVWIPAGEQGMLVVIGGALKPTDALNNNSASWNDPSIEESNNFTKEISLYDVKNGAWFTQDVQAEGGFPDHRLAQFCAVVATNFNESNTHHDIYVIGGYDGDTSSTINSDVYVLSIPSFRWTKLATSGREGTPRQGHSCFMPNPTQIMVVGGTGRRGGFLNAPRIVDVLDIDIGKVEWTGVYDSTKNDTYTPPLGVGSDSRWPDDMDDLLKEYLNTTYDRTKLKTWSPYLSEEPPPVPPSTPESSNKKWVTPVAATLGTVGGLALVGLLFFFCLWRPRRRRQQALAAKRQSHATDETAHRSWIDRWLGSTTAASSTPGKDLGSDTLTETDGAMSPPPHAMSEGHNHPSELEGYFTGGSTYPGRPPLNGEPGPHEVDATDTGVHEVHGGSSAGNSGNRTADAFRQHPLHPPSVVSAGHSRSVAGDSVSQPTDNKTDGNSSPTASVSPSPPTRSPAAAPIGSISETAAFNLNGKDSAHDTRDLARAASNRAVSPILSEGERPQRPGHRRHNSSMSSGLSPLPSPGAPESGNNHGNTL